MLLDPTVPASLLNVLEMVRGCFTAPTFRTFAALVTGLIAQTGRSTVTGILLGAGLTRTWSHDRSHAFFSRARWSPDILGISLSHMIVRRLLPEGAVLTVAVDDTLFKRHGKKVHGAAWQHDGAAKGSRPVGRGTCFVVVGIVVQLPFVARPVCLPVIARLWRPKQEQSKVDLAASMIRLLAACHYARRIHVVADAAYHGRALRDLPATCTFTTRLPASAVLYDLAPPPTGRRGRPALKGQRLGMAKDLAAAGAVGFLLPRLPGPDSSKPFKGEINTVATDPCFRGRGYARAAVDALMNWMVSRECHRISLTSSSEGEPLSVSLGFVDGDPRMNWQAE
ncbi:GNAT family N-acetyltransferase [Streptomyces sp. NPDC051104]|uniref:IS701 family transposase n=1 Tax=Streptomyces sp. NPDC051104 TaxID=3155044 RepID=UPI00341CF230